MPFKSKAQAAYFNIHKKELEKKGVNVDEWNAASKGKKLPKHTKKKYQFAGDANPCGEGTQWDANTMQCIPIPQQPGLDPVFKQNNIGTPTNFNENSIIKKNIYNPNSMATDSRGTMIPQQNVNKDALDKGFNYDSDGTYRKNVYSTDNNIQEYNDAFKAINLGLDLTRGIAGVFNDASTKHKERLALQKARYSRSMYNPYEQGLNNVPVYKTGGNWIQDAVKHPGRCAHPGSAECPKGSPQYNLAMRFKHGDLHNKQYGGGEMAAHQNGVECPNGDCYGHDKMHIELPNFLHFHKNPPINKFEWLENRASFYKNNLDFGKYPVHTFDPQPQQAGVSYEPNNTVQNGGLINNTGYTPGTSTFNNPLNVIPSGNITMKQTPFPVLAKPDNGVAQVLQPGQDYNFKGAKYVTETPHMGFQTDSTIANLQYNLKNGNALTAGYDGGFNLGAKIRFKDGGADPYAGQTDKELAAAILNSGKKLTKKQKQHFKFVSEGRIPMDGHVKDAKARGSYQKGGNNNFDKDTIYIDKGTNKLVFHDEKGNMQVREVLSGKNRNGNLLNPYSKMDVTTNDTADIEKITPLGTYPLAALQTNEGKGLEFVGTQDKRGQVVGLHPTYDPEHRNQFYNNNNVADNAQSYGCVNCNKADAERVAALYAGKKAVVYDSTLSAEDNAKFSILNNEISQNNSLYPSIAKNINKYQVVNYRRGANGTLYAKDRSYDPSTETVRMNDSLPNITIQGNKHNVVSTNNTTQGDPSIVNYLNRNNQDSSFDSRAKLAQSLGIKNYKGTVEQNIQLLNTLKNAGGKKLKTGGVPEVEGTQQGNAELEQGEVYQTQQGNIQKISEDENTHENDGAIRPDVSRVLEDTSDKRKDKDSKALLVTPAVAKTIVGFKPKSSVTHSKLYEKATELYDRKLKTFTNKVDDNLEYIKQNGGQYAKNSLELNLKLMEGMVTKGEIFDSIYNHQEHVKTMNNITNDNTSQNGGFVPKFQTGSSKADALKLTDPNGWEFLGQEGKKKYYRKKGTTDVQTFMSGKAMTVSGHGDFTVDDILNNPDKFSTFANNMQDAPDDVKRKAAEDLFYKGVMPSKYTVDKSTPDQYGYMDIPDTTDNRPPIDTKYNTPINTGSSKFNEPLHWYDIAGNIDNYLSSSERIPVSFEQMDRQPLRAHELNPTMALNANQGDFKAALQTLPNSGVGYANQANLLANKYKINNETVGQYANQNNQIADRVDEINNNNKFQLDQTNFQLRDRAVTQQLQGMEVERQSKLNAFDDYLTKLAQNSQLNRNGNLVLQMTPFFDQYGKFNGKKYVFQDKGDGSGVVLDKKTGKLLKKVVYDANDQVKQSTQYIRE